MKNPCQHCQHRSVRCHSTCPDYKEFKEAIDEANEKRLAEVNVDQYVINSIKKVKKK